MNFVDCVHSIHVGSVISFNEYYLDRHERKRLSVSIEDGVVYDVIPANEKVPRDKLEQYYGEGLEDVDYLQLSQMNCPRIVVNLGANQYGEIDIKIIVLNQDFYNTGLQELTITNELDPRNQEPNYLLAQRGW